MGRNWEDPDLRRLEGPLRGYKQSTEPWAFSGTLLCGKHEVGSRKRKTPVRTKTGERWKRRRDSSLGQEGSWDPHMCVLEGKTSLGL